MPESVSFFVAGTPRPKGSKKAFVVQKKGGKPRAIVTEMAGENLKDWMQATHAAAQTHAPPEPLSGPLAVSLSFFLPRPKSHYKASGGLSTGAPRWHTKTPDLDKLVRGVLDALTGPLFQDDAIVACLHAYKSYANRGAHTGCRVTVGPALIPESALH